MWPGVLVSDVFYNFFLKGDIAFRLMNYAKPLHGKCTKYTGPCITVCDINSYMMQIGQHRAKERDIIDNGMHVDCV